MTCIIYTAKPIPLNYCAECGSQRDLHVVHEEAKDKYDTLRRTPKFYCPEHCPSCTAKVKCETHEGCFVDKQGDHHRGELGT